MVQVLLLVLFLSITLQQCPTNFVEVSGGFCAKCHVSCLTCDQPGQTGCLTCVQDYVHDSIRGYCYPPNNQSVKLVQTGYQHYHFSLMPGWSNGSPYDCTFTTILTPTTQSSPITSSYTDLPPHYKSKIFLSAWWLGTSTNNILVRIVSQGVEDYAVNLLSSLAFQNDYANRYCDSKSGNYFVQFMHRSQEMQILIQNDQPFGISEFTLLIYLCNPSCLTCSGPSDSDCLSCVDERRVPEGGECVCDGGQGWFTYPGSDYCVRQCPYINGQGQYYGIPTTDQCVLQCPLDGALPRGTLLADQLTKTCVENCPTGYLVHVDSRKCVIQCPADQFSYQGICHQQCPLGTASLSQTCLDSCPLGYFKWQQQKKCISSCPSPLFSDPTTSTCVGGCSSGYYQVESGGVGTCVQGCPLGVFGVGDTQKCQSSCPNPLFGDYVGNRLCVTQCTNGYGTLTGDRKCVSKCPQGTFAHETSKTCVLNPNDCVGYGDSKTNQCVVKGGCSLGQFSSDISQSGVSSRICVQTCPETTFSTSSHCQTTCPSPLFADPLSHSCVSNCPPPSVGSLISTCVTTCPPGSFKNPSTSRCTLACPAPFFSETSSQECVLECGEGEFAQVGVGGHRQCVQNCDVGWGWGRLCVQACPAIPPLFGDTVSSIKICVPTCSNGFGDQREIDIGNSQLRQCLSECPDGFFASNDASKLCVSRCPQNFGSNKQCIPAQDCPIGQVGDPFSNLCVSSCPPGSYKSYLTINLCVDRCPSLPSSLPTFLNPLDNTCEEGCDSPLWANNLTSTCQTTCIQGFQDQRNLMRVCVQGCGEEGIGGGQRYYGDLINKKCVPASNCPQGFFGDNVTGLCVRRCPEIAEVKTWAHPTLKLCVAQCTDGWYSDNSTGIAICTQICPSRPSLYSDPLTKKCTGLCSSGFGSDATRQCVAQCPESPITFAFSPTKKCLPSCPQGYFAQRDSKVCLQDPLSCPPGKFGDQEINQCVEECTGGRFGDPVTKLCTEQCSTGYFSDPFTTPRRCVQVCPALPSQSYADPLTKECVTQCPSPNSWADPETLTCVSRCSGDNPGEQPLYADNFTRQCVEALSCPITPSILYGSNNSRMCVARCESGQWADIVTRMCVSQCPNNTQISTATQFQGIGTRYYGYITSSHPTCTITCPQLPRNFGQNQTNLCVSLCPEGTYGDQTGNRSCVNVCPSNSTTVWYGQDNQRVCVTVCMQGTWGNVHNAKGPHCEVVPTDCPVNTFAYDGDRLCVELCPQGFYGDRSTRRCVRKCPTLGDSVVNATAGIDVEQGVYYGDMNTRICVQTCPANYGPHGSFGNNQTNTCVFRCPGNTFGDAQIPSRPCVTTCSEGTFADPLTKLCLDSCPLNYLSDPTTHSCVTICPEPLFSQNGRCVSQCTNFKLLQKRQCVETCPYSMNLFADPSSKQCVSSCPPLTPFSNPSSRTCVSTCSPLFSSNGQCIGRCPAGLYGNGEGGCGGGGMCQVGTYGDNGTGKCQSSCSHGYADGILKICVARCSGDTYGQGGVCVSTCTPPLTASQSTKTCVGNCPGTTYNQNGQCVSTCTTGYSNHVSKLCDSGCPTNYYKNEINHQCVENCPNGWYKDIGSGYCVQDCGSKFKDPVTGFCQDQCSEGMWGSMGACQNQCADGQYGYLVNRRCYEPNDFNEDPSLFADPVSKMWVSQCRSSPVLLFGDPTTRICIETCNAPLFGDPLTNECSSACSSSLYGADPSSRKCLPKCPQGLSRSLLGICQNGCDNGYQDTNTRRCVNVCPNFYFGTIQGGFGKCVQLCPNGFYGHDGDRLCKVDCAPLFSNPGTQKCQPACPSSFADPSTHSCVETCPYSLYPYADPTTNQCVQQCPSQMYGNQGQCLYDCPQGKYAQGNLCVLECQDQGGVKYFGDAGRRACFTGCSLGGYADNGSKLCVEVCGSGFAYNGTRVCIDTCPQSQNLYGDETTHKCVTLCPEGYYGLASESICTQTCPTPLLSSPPTRTCLPTCPPPFLAHPPTSSCLVICPVGFFAQGGLCVQECGGGGFAQEGDRECVGQCRQGFKENSTKMCVLVCDTGFADKVSGFCIAKCPSYPQLYGEDGVCVEECGSGFGYDGDNLCLENCPAGVFGDTESGKCVEVCPPGKFGYSSGVVRLCVAPCPTGSADPQTQTCTPTCPSPTYSDPHTLTCVTVCPSPLYSQQSSRSCVDVCGEQGGVTMFGDVRSFKCVAQCSYPNFGHQSSHTCVGVCPQGQNLFAQPYTRLCVGLGLCGEYNGKQLFSYHGDRICVEKCPQGTWADLDAKVCVQTCPVGYFRNSNDNTCVNSCPERTGQFGDPLSGNCTTKCPSTLYSIATPLRVCVSHCSTESTNLIRDNTTNSCVSIDSCSLHPLMFSDMAAGSCVFYCGGGTFAQRENRGCVGTCSEASGLWGLRESWQCVTFCPSNLYGDVLRNRECFETCSGGYFKNPVNKICVQRCKTVKEGYFDDVITGECVQACGQDGFIDFTEQVCRYSTGTGANKISTCPSGTFADPQSTHCVKFCPSGLYSDPSTSYCKSTCPSGTFADPLTNQCSASCTGSLFADASDELEPKCIQECSQGYFAEKESKACAIACSVGFALETTNTCEATCPEPYFGDQHICKLSCAPKHSSSTPQRLCLSQCVSPFYSNPLTFTCELLCPQNYFAQNVTRSCTLECPQGSFGDVSRRICVEECSRLPLLFADDRNNLCVNECEVPLFAFEESRTCVSGCGNVSALVYLADGEKRKCVLECTGQNLYADYSTNRCVQDCPPATFASLPTKQCLPSCPEQPYPTYAVNSTHKCLPSCPSLSFAHPQVRMCVLQCWGDLYGDPVQGHCVRVCGQGTFGNNGTRVCVQNCPPGTYADPSVRICVQECPAVLGLFKFHNWTCVEECPVGYYANQQIGQCVQICESNTQTVMYAYEQNKTCVMQCPYPTRGFQPNHTCIDMCPEGYFYNRTRNTCTGCPEQCTSCTSPTRCLSCRPGQNLFNGECSPSCRNTPVLSYGHPVTGVCVVVCPQGFFGDRGSFTCVQQCPNKFYGEEGVCRDCPSTCAVCVSETRCTACEMNATLAPDQMCYGNCNSTHPYSFESTCYEQCPLGTFIAITGVHCLKCSDNCLTCSSAQTCLSCHANFLHNSLCLPSCPPNFYGSPNLECKGCEGGECGGVRFWGRVVREMFAYVVEVRFSQSVEIQGDFKDYVEIKLSVGRRRVLGVEDLVNNGVPFTVQIVTDTLIKLQLQINQQIQNPTLQLIFTNPSSITSKLNNKTLQNLREQFSLQVFEFYPEQQTWNLGLQKASIVFTNTVLIIYVVSFLFSAKSIQTLQISQLMFLHCVTQVEFGANLFFYLYGMKNTILQFLPNWFTPTLPSYPLHPTSTQRTKDIFTDFNFLRNMGYIFFIVVIAIGIWAIFFIVSRTQIIGNEGWRGILEDLSKKRFRFWMLNDVIELVYVPLLWFGFSQFAELFGPGILAFNGILTLILVLFFVAYPILLLLHHVKPQLIPISAEDLSFIDEKAPLNTFATYLYMFSMVLWMVALQAAPVAQMVMLLITNIVLLIYIIKSQAYPLLDTIALTIFVLLMVTIEIFCIYFQQTQLSSVQKTKTCEILITVLTAFLMCLIIWYFFTNLKQIIKTFAFIKEKLGQRGVWGIKGQGGDEKVLWGGDEEEVTQGEIGQVFIEKVYKTKEEGKNYICVRKRILKKKKKINKVSKISEQHSEDYIRVNGSNIFQRAQSSDSDYYNRNQQFSQKSQKNPIPVPKHHSSATLLPPPPPMAPPPAQELPLQQNSLEDVGMGRGEAVEETMGNMGNVGQGEKMGGGEGLWVVKKEEVEEKRDGLEKGNGKGKEEQKVDFAKQTILAQGLKNLIQNEQKSPSKTLKIWQQEQTPAPTNLQNLIAEQEGNKKKKLMFLFEEIQDQDQEEEN